MKKKLVFWVVGDYQTNPVTYMFRLSRYKDPYEPTNQPTNQSV